MWTKRESGTHDFNKLGVSYVCIADLSGKRVVNQAL